MISIGPIRSEVVVDSDGTHRAEKHDDGGPWRGAVVRWGTGPVCPC